MMEQTEITPILERIHQRTARDWQLRDFTGSPNPRRIRERIRNNPSLSGTFPAWDLTSSLYTDQELQYILKAHYARFFGINLPQASRSEVLITPDQEELLKQSIHAVHQAMLTHGVPYPEYDPSAQIEDPELTEYVATRVSLDYSDKRCRFYASTDSHSSYGEGSGFIFEDRVNNVNTDWNYDDLRRFTLNIDFKDGISYDARGELNHLTDDEYTIVQHYLAKITQIAPDLGV